MTTRTLALAFAAVLAAGCAARRAPAAAAPPPAAAAAPAPDSGERPLSVAAANAVKTASADDGSTLICRIERPTGSNIAKRVCRTKASIENDRRAAQDVLVRPRGTQARDR